MDTVGIVDMYLGGRRSLFELGDHLNRLPHAALLRDRIARHVLWLMDEATTAGWTEDEFRADLRDFVTRTNVITASARSVGELTVEGTRFESASSPHRVRGRDTRNTFEDLKTREVLESA